MCKDIFSERCCIISDYPIFGKVKIYTRHNENMGKCMVISNGFITPNMPKLHYAIQYSVDTKQEKLILNNELNPELTKFSSAHVFEKRDGFNCLFYKYKDKVIPKTRMTPIASGKILQIIKLPDFPLKQIEQMVKDGYVPIFEVWGTILEKYGIMHGSVNVRKVTKIEKLPELNVDLISVLDANYANYDYRFLEPTKIIELAYQYDINPVKYHGKVSIDYDSVFRIIRSCEDINSHEILTEGRVLHCYNGNEYKMFKVKPLNIMTNDVVYSKTIPRERIMLEISKILVETDILEIVSDPIQYIREVIEYLSEDYKMSNKKNKRVMDVFIEVVSNEFVKQYPEKSKEPWKYNVHKMLIGTIRRLS